MCANMEPRMAEHPCAGARRPRLAGVQAMGGRLMRSGPRPEWQDKLRAEMRQLALPPGAPLPYERLSELALLEMAFKQAMRINPPVPGILRAAVRDFQFKGHDIPAGTRIAISTIFTHRMPEIWPEPLKFDPLRFTDNAVRARHKYAWVPFGGGAHMCLGFHFAYMQAVPTCRSRARIAIRMSLRRPELPRLVRFLRSSPQSLWPVRARDV